MHVVGRGHVSLGLEHVAFFVFEEEVPFPQFSQVTLDDRHVVVDHEALERREREAA